MEMRGTAAVGAAASGTSEDSGERPAPPADHPPHAADHEDESTTEAHTLALPEHDQSSPIPPPLLAVIQVRECPAKIQPTHDTGADDCEVDIVTPLLPVSLAPQRSSGEWSSSRRSGRRPDAATRADASSHGQREAATSSRVTDIDVRIRGSDSNDRSGQETKAAAAGQSKKKKEQQGELLVSMLEKMQTIETELQQILTPLEQQLSPASWSKALASSTSGSVARDINDHHQQRLQGQSANVEANVLESGEDTETYSGKNREEETSSVCVATLDDESDGRDLRDESSRALTVEVAENHPNRLVLLDEAPSDSSLEGVQITKVTGSDGAVSSRSHTFLTEVHEPHNVDALISSVAEDAPGETSKYPNATGTDDDDDETLLVSFSVPTATDVLVASDWIECITEAGIAYYYNKQTHESQWTPPAHWMPPTGTTTTTASATGDSENTAAYPSNALFEAAMGVELFANQLDAILESGVNVHGQDATTGPTPLHVACQYGNVHAAAILLHYGADANGVVKNHDKLMPSPLSLACRHNHIDVMQLLLDHGASWAMADDDGNSLLHVCIASQSQDALLYLLDVATSSDVNSSYSILGHRNHEDETPLHVAVKFGYVDAVRALLRYGASIDAEDSQGRTPLVLSIMENQVECAQLLQTQSHGVRAHVEEQKQDEEESGGDGNTAVHYESSLEQLQSYMFQVLAHTKGSDELSHVIYQFVSHAQRQIRALTNDLQVVKQREERHVLQLEALRLDLTRSQDELAKAQETATHTQDQLQSHEIELESVRTSHHALASRCELLDSIARASQDKLKRERVEHIRYEEHLQTQLQASMDENAGLLVHLTSLQDAWSNNGQQVQEQQYASHGSNDNDYDYAATGSTVQEQDVSQQSPREAYNLQSPYHSQQQYTTTGDMARASNHMAEGTSFEDSRENGGGEPLYLDEFPHEEDGEDAGESVLLQSSRNNVVSTSATPSISPSRVDAVWNKFFENMTIAAERTSATGGSKNSVRVRQMPPSSTLHHQAPQVNPSALFTAIRKNRFADLQQLLFRGCPVNVRDIGEKGTPLHLACELGDLDALKLLCEFGADVELRDEAGNPPLLVACSQGHYECVKFLLQSAANLTSVNAIGDSALHLAAWDGSVECIDLLLEYGIDPLVTNNFGLTALANVKTRSPLRHKFDDLVDDHPMRKTLILLEECEENAQEEIVSEPEHTIQEDVKGRALVSVPPEGGHTNGAADKVTWKDWLFGFGGKRRPEELRPASLSSNSDQNHEGDEDDEEVSEDETERGQYTGSDDDDDVLSSFEDDPHLSTLRYEPLQPPPEIEAELQRAKMQRQRPATLPAATSGRNLQTPQHFVAADRKRVSLASAQNKASSAAASAHNVRARYVDTFNSP